MKPHYETNVTHEGTMNGERLPFQIDVSSPAARAHLMGILTDTYTDPIMAALREPATNAQDSHLASGQTRPIEVYLPDKIDPVYTVRDYGVGMSRNDLTENFLKFLWSSKRENDVESGMLGLGCKAPLTYVSQFTVVARKNGWQSTALVSRGDDGMGGLEIDSHLKTSEPDGVEVCIPVDDIDIFVQKAMFFFGFWEKGTVLVNGKEPPSHFEAEGSRALDPDVILLPKGHEWKSSWVVMGNVPYKAGYGVYCGNSYVLARVPMGAVDFTSAREGVRETPRAIETLKTIKKFADEAVQRVAQAEVDAAPTPSAAIKEARIWHGRNGDLDLTYRGKKIPWHLNLGDVKGFDYNLSRDSAIRFQRIDKARIASSSVDEVAFVVGYDMKSLHRSHRDKLAIYVEGEYNVSRYLFVDKAPDNYWLQGAPVIQWEDVSAIKLPKAERQPSSSPKRPPKFAIVNEHGTINYTRDPDFSGKVVVVEGSTKDFWVELAGCAFPDSTVVVLASNRIDKFFRENKGAIRLQKAAEIEARRLDYRMTEEDRQLIGGQSHVTRKLTRVSPDKVRDPKVRKYLEKRSKTDVSTLKRQVDALNRIVLASRGKARPIMYPNVGAASAIHSHLLENYPLIEHVQYYDVKGEHIIEYINAMYLTRQERKA